MAAISPIIVFVRFFFWYGCAGDISCCQGHHDYGDTSVARPRAGSDSALLKEGRPEEMSHS